MPMTFDSRFTLGATLPEFDQDTVKNEPMLFSCNVWAAMEKGGPITRAFIANLMKDPEFRVQPVSSMIIDTRVHMLMPGWFPAIPGWHHDDVPRNTTSGQPNYRHPPYRAQHALALVNGDIAPTEFAVGKATVSDPEVVEALGRPIYAEWHQEVEEQVDAGLLIRTPAPSNRIVRFDSAAFHQAVRATAGGWRWFGRATFNTGRKPLNELRRQVQVYLEHPMEGW